MDRSYRVAIENWIKVEPILDRITAKCGKAIQEYCRVFGCMPSKGDFIVIEYDSNSKIAFDRVRFDGTEMLVIFKVL